MRSIVAPMFRRVIATPVKACAPFRVDIRLLTGSSVPSLTDLPSLEDLQKKITAMENKIADSEAKLKVAEESNEKALVIALTTDITELRKEKNLLSQEKIAVLDLMKTPKGKLASRLY